MKPTPLILTLILAALNCGCTSPQAVSHPALERQAAVPMDELTALLAAQPQLAYGGETAQTSSGLPKLYGITARALKRHASQQQIAALYATYGRDAANGDRIAQWSVAKFYEEGLGRDQDPARALQEYRKAADLGDTDAMNQIGYLYANGQGVAQSWDEAVRWYRQAAERGLSTAQLNLAWRYQKGEGVEQDDAEAVRWFERAVRQNDAQAQYELALCQWQGKGTPPDIASALRWLRQSAAQKFPAALGRLGELTRAGMAGAKADAHAAEDLLRQAADLGDPVGMEVWAQSLEGTSKVGEALYWHQRAADAGEARAQLRLATLYEEGHVLPHNLAEAARRLEQAAKSGNAEGQFRYALALRESRGVVRNDEASLQWLEKAKAQGYRVR